MVGSRRGSMTVMSVARSDTAERDHEREAIHSGHFMVSAFEAEDQDDEDQVAVPVLEEEGQASAAAYTRGGLKPSLRQQLSIETSLTKLFQCMSLAYRQKLTSPKWNMFKGLRLRWKDKIRLNNVIWRCWHIQFVNKKRTLVCQFASPLDIHTHNKPEAIVMEGKYWKRRLHAVTAEYKKWRMFYRNRLLGRYLTHDALYGLEGIDWQSTGSVKESNMLLDDHLMDFVSDTLFTTISANQPFAFPDSREIARGAGLADFIQPSLVQLQPNLDEIMDFEPFQELLQTTKMNDVFSGGDCSMESKPSMDYFGGETSTWVLGDYCRGIPMQGGGVMRQVMSNVLPPAPPQPDTSAIMMTTPPVVDTHQMPPSAPPPPMVQPTSNTQVASHPVLPTQLDPSSRPQPQPYQPPVLTEMEIRRPPITTTTNTFYFQKNAANSMRPTPQPNLPSEQVPLLNQMLNTSANYQYLKREESSNQSSQEVPYILGANIADPNRIPDGSPYLYPTPSGSGGKEMSQMMMPSMSSVVPLPCQSSQPILSNIQPVHNMGLVSGASVTTSPDSPVNSEPLSPVNLGSPLSSPSPSPSRPSQQSYRDCGRRPTHINAEQMRRCNIKNGFDTLHSMLPHVNHSPNSKVSKAALLQKGAEYIRQLRAERSQLQQEIDLLKKQVEELNNDISICQEKLPATGAPVSRQKSGKIMDLFRQFVRIRTLENWKYWILSLFCEPLLSSFADTVSTSSPDELYNTTLHWIDQHCTLVQLRPVMLNALRKLCTVTEVLADPQRLPVEARNAVEGPKRENKRS